ncbi:MAG: chemotaxis protein CheB [Desulfobulbaceae bacterium]|nr:MAG: chemotaxis protein CheB [Desulfobulbaceae bacterium]
MKNRSRRRFAAAVIGVSAGGLNALSRILPLLHRHLALSVLVVQHLRPDSDSYLVHHLARLSTIRVKEAEDKEAVEPGTVYIAPPDYHLLVESDRSLSLSAEERVNFSRPSIDVTFETAAEAFQDQLIGIVLTGANNDGSRGLARIKYFGGMTVVQSPESAEYDIMPRSAIDAVDVDRIVPLDGIAGLLNTLAPGEIDGEGSHTAGR